MQLRGLQLGVEHATLDLQTNALPTELQKPFGCEFCIYVGGNAGEVGGNASEVGGNAATASVVQSVERWSRDPGSLVQFQAGGLGVAFFATGSSCVLWLDGIVSKIPHYIS